jgi:hypothetical protein
VPCLWAPQARSGQRSACRAAVGAVVALKGNARAVSGVRDPGSRGEKAWVPPEADAWGGCRSPLRFHAHRASRFGVGAWVLGLEVLPLVALLSGSGCPFIGALPIRLN